MCPPPPMHCIRDATEQNQRRSMSVRISLKILAGATTVLGAASALGLAVLPQAANTARGETVAAQQFPTVPSNGQMGFVISAFSPAIVPGMKDPCPAGFNNSTEKNTALMLPAAERARMALPENAKEWERRWKTPGPNNTNVCTNFDQFPKRPTNKLVQNNVALGMDLDRKVGGTDTCAHEEFVSPEGETGIDNQLYRAMGCSSSWRGPDGAPGEIEQVLRNYITRGEYSIVMLLKGVNSFVRDDDVEVILATTNDLPMLDPRQNFLPDATFNVSANPRWRNAMRGNIKDGVVTVAGANIILKRPVANGGARSMRAEWDFSDAQMRMQLLPDGSIKGLLGGYQSLLTNMNLPINRGAGTALVANYDCAADWNTLRKMADGGRDPKTGMCTRISTAFKVEGVRAFVVDAAKTPRTAAR
jgi:hypothetical protein